MQDEAEEAVIILPHTTQDIVDCADLDRGTEIAAEEHRFDGQGTDQDRGDGEHDEGARDDPRRLVQMPLGVVAQPFLAMEDQEQQAEAVERGHEHPAQDREIGDAGPR